MFAGRTALFFQASHSCTPSTLCCLNQSVRCVGKCCTKECRCLPTVAGELYFPKSAHVRNYPGSQERVVFASSVIRGKEIKSGRFASMGTLSTHAILCCEGWATFRWPWSAIIQSLKPCTCLHLLPCRRRYPLPYTRQAGW